MDGLVDGLLSCMIDCLVNLVELKIVLLFDGLLV